MQDLSNIVSVRRLTRAWHTLYCDYHAADRPASVVMQWVGLPDGGRRKRGRPMKTWRQTLKHSGNLQNNSLNK